MGLATAALLLSWRRWRRVDSDLARPVEEVVDVLQRLADGEEEARPAAYPCVEFSRLSAGVRTLAEAAQRRREEADGQRSAARRPRGCASTARCSVAQELSAYVDARQLAQALLTALHRVAGVDRAVLLAVEAGHPAQPLGLLDTSTPPEPCAGADEALRFLRLVLSDGGRRCSVPVVHALAQRRRSPLPRRAGDRHRLPLRG